MTSAIPRRRSASPSSASRLGRPPCACLARLPLPKDDRRAFSFASSFVPSYLYLHPGALTIHSTVHRTVVVESDRWRNSTYTSSSSQTPTTTIHVASIDVTVTLTRADKVCLTCARFKPDKGIFPGASGAVAATVMERPSLSKIPKKCHDSAMSSSPTSGNTSTCSPLEAPDV